MSQYITFFLRANDNFIPLYSFSRNGYMYAAFHSSAPFEKISVVTFGTLNAAQNVLLDQIDTFKRKSDEYEKEQKLIPTFDNSVAEKLESIRHIDCMIADLQSELDELELALSYCTVMNDILETAKYGEKAVGVSTYHEETLLYCGIEITNPTMQDIV